MYSWRDNQIDGGTSKVARWGANNTNTGTHAQNDILHISCEASTLIDFLQLNIVIMCAKQFLIILILAVIKGNAEEEVEHSIVKRDTVDLGKIYDFFTNDVVGQKFFMIICLQVHITLDLTFCPPYCVVVYQLRQKNIVAKLSPALNHLSSPCLG